MLQTKKVDHKKHLVLKTKQNMYFGKYSVSQLLKSITFIALLTQVLFFILFDYGAPGVALQNFLKNSQIE